MTGTTTSPQTEPKIDLTQQVRFAVVMYGGSSLAVYMNGVAQELFRLVRSTAGPDGGSPYARAESTETVYRKLGQMLIRGESPRLDAEERPDSNIRTQFVIDILSGTSAGGINAVFLAKALASCGNMDSLQELWLRRADIGELLNDTQSRGKPVPAQKPPRSLLNSALLYYELLDALESMDDTPPETQRPARSPYVTELDLFTTATDLQGMPVQLKLADLIAHERRHLNSFHFKYRSNGSDDIENDFRRDLNPFLAFAARCTSAHPVPFEPVRLSDIDEILDRHPKYSQWPDIRSKNKQWRRFYEDYLSRAGGNPVHRDELAEDFRQRSFNDGGVLDNSPFTFAIDQLQARTADLPVDRKLLYIEPVPEHGELTTDNKERPDALKNAILSLTTLPRYQFIRDDLQRLLDRNRLIERVRRIVKGIEQDEIARLEQGTGVPLTSEQFRNQTMKTMIGRMGSAWGGYHRLRVSETTDNFVKMIANGAGYQEGSAEFSGIRHLVSVWRNGKYAAYPAKDQISETEFLFLFDLRWRIRRQKLLLKKADELSCFDGNMSKLLCIDSDKQRLVRQYLALQGTEEGNAAEGAFRSHLRHLKARTGRVLMDLLRLWETMMRVPEDGSSPTAQEHPLKYIFEKPEIIDGLRKSIATIMQHDTEAVQRNAAAVELEKHDELIKNLAEALEHSFSAAMIKASEDMRAKDVLNHDGSDLPDTLTPQYVATTILRYYYDNFDRYDMITYPILYASGAGEEADPVEVFRIGPEDAGVLVRNPADRRRKLAGVALANFGAFFEERFRENDILWGRLDCAERIITALLRTATPADERIQKQIEAKRLELIREAHETILAEHGNVLKRLLGTDVLDAKSAAELTADLRVALSKASVNPAVQNYIINVAAENSPISAFLKAYSFDHRMSPKSLVHSAGRASRILGKMLDDIAEKRTVAKASVAWMTRLLQVFWAMVELALPGGMWNLATAHWWKLLYLFEVLMLVGGTLLLNETVQQFGLAALTITGGIHAGVLALGQYMNGKPLAHRCMTAAACALIGVTGGLGALLLLTLLGFTGLNGHLYFLVGEPGADTFWRVTIARIVLVFIVVLSVLLAWHSKPAEDKR